MSSSADTSALNVVILGGGNAVHILAGLVPSTGKFNEVSVLSTFGDEAARFAASAAEQGGEIHLRRHKEGPNGEDVTVRGKFTRATNDPSVVADADLIILAVPAFAHEGYLKAIKPHIRRSGSRAPGGRVILGATPGQSGFDIQAQSILGQDLFDSLAIFDLETLPWAARLTEYGKSADILGTKESVDLAVSPPRLGQQVASVLANLMGGPHPALNLVPSILALTLSSINSVWHPTIIWGRFRDWDFKTPFDTLPMFYEEVDDETGDMLTAVSDEVLAVKRALETRHGLDLTGVHHVRDWMLQSYEHDIEDKSSLRRMINTNKGYQGIPHPMKKTEDGKYMLDVKYRYLSEDLPEGLVVVRGVAELCGVETPNMDVVIEFGQKAMGKKYLVDGKLNGPDAANTRTPQAFGIKSVEDLIERLHYAKK